MSIAHCLLNSKVGDYITIGKSSVQHMIVDKKYLIFSSNINPSGYYPVVANGYGNRTTVYPGSYKVSRIIKCQ